jgi:hypothetical protein
VEDLQRIKAQVNSSISSVASIFLGIKLSPSGMWSKAADISEAQEEIRRSTYHLTTSLNQV